MYHSLSVVFCDNRNLYRETSLLSVLLRAPQIATQGEILITRPVLIQNFRVKSYKFYELSPAGGLIDLPRLSDSYGDVTPARVATPAGNDQAAGLRVGLRSRLRVGPRKRFDPKDATRQPAPVPERFVVLVLF